MRAFIRQFHDSNPVDRRATELHRGSLYQAFGSKRGLFIAVLQRVTSSAPLSGRYLDLLLAASWIWPVLTPRYATLFK